MTLTAEAAHAEGIGCVDEGCEAIDHIHPEVFDPPTYRGVRYRDTGMVGTATFIAEVAVIRAEPTRRCERCGKRRVVFALTVTNSPIGNQDHEWRCARCWKLR